MPHGGTGLELCQSQHTICAVKCGTAHTLCNHKEFKEMSEGHFLKNGSKKIKASLEKTGYDTS